MNKIALMKELRNSGWEPEEIRRALKLGVPEKHALTWARARRPVGELITSYEKVAQAARDLPAVVLMLVALVAHIKHVFTSRFPSENPFRNSVLTRWLRSFATTFKASLILAYQSLQGWVCQNIDEWNFKRGCIAKAKFVGKKLALGQIGWFSASPRSYLYTVWRGVAWVLTKLTGLSIFRCLTKKGDKIIDRWDGILRGRFTKQGGCAIRCAAHQVMGPVLTGITAAYFCGPLGLTAAFLGSFGRALFNCIPFLRLGITMLLTVIAIGMQYITPWLLRWLINGSQLLWQYICHAGQRLNDVRKARKARRLALRAARIAGRQEEAALREEVAIVNAEHVGNDRRTSVLIG